MTPRNKRRLSGLACGLAVLLGTFAPTGADAAPADQKRAEAARLAARLEALGQRESVLAEQYNEARLALAAVAAEVAQAEAGKAETVKRFGQVRSRAKDRAVQAYIEGGSMSRTARLVEGDASEVLLMDQYLSAAAGDDQQAIDALRAAREDLEAKEAALAGRLEAAKAAEAEVRTNRRSVSATASELRSLYARTRGELDALVRAEERRRAEAAGRAARARVARPPRASRSGVYVAPPGTDVPAPSSGAAAAVAFARQQIGKPYKWGGSGPDSYDCSGLTMMAWRQGGRSLPHSSRAQYSSTTHVPLSAIQPGDLLFFGRPIHHVGIYVGGGQMIAAPQTGRNVQYQTIHRRDLVGVGRP